MEIEDHALEFATNMHKGQLRKGGHAPYIEHPKRVAAAVRKYVLDHGIDYGPSKCSIGMSMVVAGYLHDGPEDCGITIDKIAEEFGPMIASFVDWMTNKTHGMNLPRAERKRLDRERLSAAPREVKIIKMLDRIDNLTDTGLTDEFKKKYVAESLLLVEVLRDADEELAGRLMEAAKKLEG
jgi:(p)ppGpp synthase/HD superfamily hydrolase